MIKVIGVRFRSAGKIYFFSPGELEIKKGDHVIVETARGVEFGKVVLGNRDVEEEKVIQPLKQVIRMATPEDIAAQKAHREKSKEAYKICQEKIRKHELDMKLIDVEYTFDGNKILFYFTADGRVDFRELVKDLASVFRTRIELRQIGVRDETKLLGGIGICGRPLCCNTFLSDYAPVSIKMAKEQNLSLNPTKISGVCGRLMCCLKNEEETYEYLNSKMPANGDFVTAADGTRGQVQSTNVLRQTVKVIVNTGDDEKELREYRVEELKFRPKRKKNAENDSDESAELQALEDGDFSGAEKQGRKKERSGRGNREGRDGQERENRGRGGRENREEKDGQERENRGKGGRGNREGRDGQERENRGKGGREGREEKDGQERERRGRGSRDSREGKDGQERGKNQRQRGRRDGQEPGNRENSGRPEEKTASNPGDSATNSREPERGTEE